MAYVQQLGQVEFDGTRQVHGSEALGSKVGKAQRPLAQQRMASAAEKSTGKSAQRVDRPFFTWWQVACVSHKEVQTPVLKVLQ
jgi:hypothetical protein